MVNHTANEPLLFLVEVLFGFYAGLVALRIIMQWAQWEYANPLVQFILQLTQAPVKLLRKFIPSLGRWDSATIVLLILVCSLKVTLLLLLNAIPLSLTRFFPWLIFDIFSLFITLFTASIIIQVILSWLGGHTGYNPIVPLVQRMNQPLLAPLRRVIPLVAGIDLSPLIAILILQILPMLVSSILFAY